MRRTIPLVLAAILLTSCASYTVRDGLDRIDVPETGFLVPVKKAEISPDWVQNLNPSPTLGSGISKVKSDTASPFLNSTISISMPVPTLT